jgi:4-alpha-glucanotransferase
MRPALRALADHVGILPSYLQQNGRDVRETSDATREALLSALGHDASTEAAAAQGLAELERLERARLVPPVQVWREYEQAQPMLRASLPPELAQGKLAWQVELALEDGSLERIEGESAQAGEAACLELPIPGKPRPGYHVVRLRLRCDAGERRADQTLILAPRSCFGVTEGLGQPSGFGLWTNLYSARRQHDWGFGDLGTLRECLQLCADVGGAFVGVNPLHATLGQGSGISPYSPMSRIFKSPLYLEVDAIPELSESAEARALVHSGAFRSALGALRAAPMLDYTRLQALREPVLRALHRTFRAQHEDRNTPRGEAWLRFRQRWGDTLTDFATFAALRASLEQKDPALGDFERWPVALRDPRSSEVERFRVAHADEVGFQAWLQFELDRQLCEVAAFGHAAGLPIGLYEDLAVGSAADSGDAWSFPSLFVRGVTIGAPPDDYSNTGQDWGLPPIDPIRLRADRYRYWILVLRAAFAHSGALRIDHVMGLFRLFWIAGGQPGSEGAYVRYPADDLLGILALESRRHRTLIVGEDLGTVPAEVPGTLASWGILSSRVLYFERDDWSGFHPSKAYSARALVTANTHDLPPLAGYWTDRDLLLRREVGQIESDEELAAACARRESERAALLHRLSEEGCLGGEPAGVTERCAAVNSFLCRTPAPLVGVSLDDLAGEAEPVNLPGVPVEHYPSWSRRMRQRIDEIAASPETAQALAGLSPRRARGDPARGEKDATGRGADAADR